MLAVLGDVPLRSDAHAFEPKYDGVRALAAVTPGPPPSVTLWSRTGREISQQFPEVAAALARWAEALAAPVLLDGEIVATGASGQLLGFQHLQTRLNRTSPDRTAARRAVFIAFDILRDGDDDIRPLPLRTRRARLATLFDGPPVPLVRLAEHAAGDGRALHAHAAAHGGEGLIAKRLDAPYRSGARTPDWQKLKLVRRLSAVIGGWTAPRGLRTGFGALILGQYDREGRLIPIGQVGTGFSEAELARLSTRLRALARSTSPFDPVPRTAERAHWVTPTLVAEVTFMEWTQEGRLRHPTYLGLRDDVPARDIVRGNDVEETRPAPRPRARVRPGTAARTADGVDLLHELRRLQEAGGDGTIALPDGGRLELTHLRKVLWPALGLTKGDLLRHYARVAPMLVSALADRPLVMKRYPNGIDARPFYQHRAPVRVPPGVRVESVTATDGARAHLVGGTLTTLLYTAQLAAISQDPWGSRVGTEDCADYAVFDLDPPDADSFPKVLAVARALKAELDTLGVSGMAKTSGSRGLHVFVRLPPGTPHDAAQLYAQIIATVVAARHPALATVERAIPARRGRVYVDTLQNARGKTLASVYSARANAWAGVSTPVTWAEIARGAIDPRDFTIPTMAARLDAVGDLWAAFPRTAPADLLAVSRYDAPSARTRTAPRRPPDGA